MRHPLLAAYSREHQALLEHANRLDAAAKYPPPHQAQVARPFLDFWTTRLLAHVEEEERCVFPAYAKEDMVSRVARVGQELQEQVDWLRFCVLDPGGPGPVLTAVANSLRQHVRLCEWEVFDGLQDTLDAQGFKAVAKAIEGLRRERAGGGANGVQPIAAPGTPSAAASPAKSTGPRPVVVGKPIHKPGAGAQQPGRPAPPRGGSP